VIARLAGAALLVLGAALAGLPALDWYSAPVPGGAATASGFGGAGELWVLPALGALVALAGAGLVAAPPGRSRAVARWAGLAALVAGALALGWAVRAAVDPPVVLTVDLGAGRRELAAPVALEQAAITTPIVAGLAAAIGAAAIWAGLRR
jgi:hypothetical protein